jgi:serine-protein kinase ATM
VIYERANTNNVVETRLNKASSILRLLIIHVYCTKRFMTLYKPRQSEKVVNMLLKNFTYDPIEANVQLFDPVILNVAKSLNQLMKTQCFIDHMFTTTLQHIVERTLKCLRMTVASRSRISKNENIIIELLTLLHELLNPSYIQGHQLFAVSTNEADLYYTHIVQLIANYFRNIFSDNKRERESLILIFKIMNRCMLDLCTRNVKLCHMIYKLGLQFILETKAITSRRLVSELAVFLNLAPNYVALNHLQMSEGDDWDISETGELMHQPALVSLRSGKSEISDVFSAVINASSEAEESQLLSDEDIPSSVDKGEPFRKRKRNDSQDTGTQHLYDLSKMIEIVFNLFHENTLEKPLELADKSVNLHLFPLDGSKQNIFHMKYSSLAEGQQATPFLLRLGLGKMIVAYYRLKAQLSESSFDAYANNLKRQRFSNVGNSMITSLSDLLQHFDNPIEFLVSSLSDMPPGNLSCKAEVGKILALLFSHISTCSDLRSSQQLLTFVLCNKKDILFKLMSAFEKQSITLKYWILFTISIFHAIINDFVMKGYERPLLQLYKNESFLKLLKYCLELLKDPTMTKLTCVFLSQFALYQTQDRDICFELDKSIVQQYENVFDLSEINGPAFLCKESVIFWMSSLFVCKRFKFRSVKFHTSSNITDAHLFSSKVSNWYFGKFHQMGAATQNDDILFICLLISWLSGDEQNHPTIEKMYHERIFQGQRLNFALELERRRPLCATILQLQTIEKIVELRKGSISLRLEPLISTGNVKYLMKSKIGMFLDAISENENHLNWSVCLSIILPSDFLGLKGSLEITTQLIKDRFRSFRSESNFRAYLIDYFKLADHLHSCCIEWSIKVAELLSSEQAKDISLYLSNQEDNISHTDSDADFLDSEMPTEINILNADFPDYSTYNTQNLYYKTKTLEQCTVVYMFQHCHGDGDNDHGMKMVIEYCTKIKSNFKVMASAYEIMKVIVRQSYLPTEASIDSLFVLLTSLLEDHLTKTYESCIVLISVIFRELCPSWISSKSGIESDGRAVFDFFMNLHQRNMLSSERSHTEFFKFCCAILTTDSTDITLFDSNLIMLHLTETFGMMSNQTKHEVSTNVAEAVGSCNDKIRTYQVFHNAFVNPHESIEKSATFCIYLTTLSTADETLIIASVIEFLKFSCHESMRPYIQLGMQILSNANGIKSTHHLFWNFKDLFCRSWLASGSSFDQFPYYLFGFEYIDDFILKTYKEIVALELAWGKISYFDKVVKVTGMKEVSLVTDSLSLAISFLFCEGKKQTDLFRLFVLFLGPMPQVNFHLKEQFPLICFQLLRYCDVSSELKLALITKDANHALFSDSAILLPFLNDYNMSIAPGTCLELIAYFSSKFGIDEIWSTQLVYYLASRLLLLLESSVLKVERLTHLRRLKVLIAISPLSLEHTQVAELLTRNLSDYLTDDTLTNDVSLLLSLMIERNRNDFGRISISTWFSIIGSLFYQTSNRSTKLLKQILELRGEVDLGEFTSAFNMGIDIIGDNNSSERLDLVEYVNTAFSLTQTTHDLVKYLSLLFETSSDLQNNCFEMTREECRNMKFIQSIFEIKLRYSSSISKFMLRWIGKCLGTYYEETGLSPQNKIYEFDSPLLFSSNIAEFNRDTKSMDIIFKLMIDNLPNSSLQSRYYFDSIAGVILHRHLNLAENMSSFISYDSLLSPFEDYILPFGDYVCSLSMDEVQSERVSFSKLGLDATLNGFDTNIRAYDYMKWTSDILFAVITELSAQSSIFILLANYTSHVPTFSAKCFCPLILYYIETQSLKRGKLIGRMIEAFFELNVDELAPEAVSLFVELVLLVRIGTKYGMEKFISIGRHFNIPKICKAALSIGKNKTSLMLLEDQCHLGIDKWSESSLTEDLKNIYSGIEDKDLMFGLPIVPQLQYGTEILKYNGIKWGEMMFNNAFFESELHSGNLSTEKLFDISGGMMHMGWSGVSNILREFTSEGNSSNNYNDKKNVDLMYEQMWKLNQWEIPASDEILTENSCVYSALKCIKEAPEKSSDICEAYIERLVEMELDDFRLEGSTRSEAIHSWIKTLSICNGIQKIASLKDTVFFDHIETYRKSSQWFRDANISDYENLSMSRLTILEIMRYSQADEVIGGFKLSTQLCNIGAVNEWHSYSSLVTDRGVSQKAINSAVMLNKISSEIYHNKNAAVETIAKFDMAKAFWTQKSDTRFPVETLKAILRDATNNSMESVAFVEDGVNPEQIKGITHISKALVSATLAKWCDECMQETSSAIMSNHILPLEQSINAHGSLANSGDLGLTFHIMARFCDDQIAKILQNESAEKRIEKISALEADIKALTKYLKQEDDREKRRVAGSELTRLKLRYSEETTNLNHINKGTQTYTAKAINFYFKSIGFGDHEFVDSDIDRFCSLWIEHTEIKIKEDDLLGLPTFNFVTWSNQLVSKLLDENTAFQTLLKKLVINIAIDHPFHVLYLLKSLIMTKKESDDIAAISRGKTAENIWRSLKSLENDFRVEGIPHVMDSVGSFADRAIEIANVKLKNSKRISVLKMPNGNWWAETLPELSLPSPVCNIKVKKNGSYKTSDLSIIVKVEEMLAVASSGISHPKIMKIVLSTGDTQKMLLKSPDDLRQDAIMQQVFEKVNKLLWKDIDARKRHLRIRTYKVLPLGPTSGVLEFVPNSMALMDILKSLHQGDKMSISDARAKMKEVQDQSKAARVKAYKDICKKVSPSLKTFFFNNFTSPDIWFESRSVYCHGIATTSITGYTLGIGDRHCNNILLDKASGEPIHIDFGVAFDQGKSLPVPETVPFRLSRDIVDGMGVTGESGMFSKSCEHVLRVLRENRQYICGILNVLKYDPLYTWTLSPLRKRKLQQIYYAEESNNSKNLEVLSKNVESEATSAIETVNKKLEAKGLSDEAVVRELIREATSPENLALIFMGWSPFL